MEELIKDFLTSKYGIKATIQKLDGYEYLNYLVFVEGKPKFILKLTSDLTTRPFLEVQNLVYQQLESLKKYSFPQYVYGKDGNNICLFTDHNGIQYLAHLLVYISGGFLSNVNKTSELLEKFGQFLAEVNIQLKNFNHPVIQARHYKWDLQYFSEYKKYIKYIKPGSRKKYIEYFLMHYNENVIPILSELRKSTIHSDANDWNVLTNENDIIGLIDFGDVVYSPTVNELAIAAAYVALDKDDPLQNIAYLIVGYHREFPLDTKEIEILYYLIGARLCTSVCQSAKTKDKDPGNEYVSVQEKSFWNLIEQWVSISPDHATSIFKHACSIPVSQDKSNKELINARYRYFSKALSISYDKPVIMERAAFQYMFDQKGNTYLDCVNNIMHVGHCHPRVVEAGQRQMAKLNTNTRYLYDSLNNYAEKLLDKFPPSLNKIFFVNSGSAASDLAIRLARNYTDKRELMVMDYGYHGNTSIGIEISPYKFKGKGGKGPAAYIHTAPVSGEDSGYSEKELYARIDSFMEHPIAAFICEPIVGCGGQIMMNEVYLKTIYNKVRSNGGVCIADEVQTGFGRVGSKFWAYALYDVVPDIVVLGKPMGNGHPIGAVVTTNSIAEAFENGMEFFSSFGGNPVSCKIGEAVLEVIESESLQENALNTGHQIVDGFNEIRKENDMISDVRGAGLFIGVELVNKQQQDIPATEEANKIVNSMKEKGILLSTDGPDNNVIKIKPPICLNMSNVDQLLTEFRQTIKAF